MAETVDEKKLAKAARTALTQCLVLKPSEKLLVIVNPETRRIGEALYKEGLKITPHTLLMVYPKGSINGETRRLSSPRRWRSPT